MVANADTFPIWSTFYTVCTVPRKNVVPAPSKIENKTGKVSAFVLEFGAEFCKIEQI